MERSKKKCVHCRRLKPHKRKDSIGICSLYNVLVLDTLCGCVRQTDGTVKLLNFKLSNDEVTAYGCNKGKSNSQPTL